MREVGCSANSRAAAKYLRGQGGIIQSYELSMERKDEQDAPTCEIFERPAYFLARVKKGARGMFSNSRPNFRFTRDKGLRGFSKLFFVMLLPLDANIHTDTQSL